MIPDGKLIDAIRQRKGFTIEKLADKSDVGVRTLQKALAGESINITTLQALAKTLGVGYETLLADKAEELSQAVQQTIMQFQVPVVAGVADPNAIASLIEFLKKMLPSDAGFTVLAVAGSSILISVNKSEASTDMTSGLDAIGCKFTGAIPNTIMRFGEDEPFDYLGWGHTHHAMRQVPPPPPPWNRPWDELSLVERLEFTLAQVRLEYRVSWDGKEQLPDAPLADQYTLAKAADGASDDGVWSLMCRLKHTDQLRQIEAILERAKGGR